MRPEGRTIYICEGNPNNFGGVRRGGRDARSTKVTGYTFSELSALIADVRREALEEAARHCDIKRNRLAHYPEPFPSGEKAALEEMAGLFRDLAAKEEG